MQIIDGYTHYTPPRCLEALTKSRNVEARKAASTMQSICDANPHFIDGQRRLQDLDNHSIHMQVTMVHNTIDPNGFSISHEEQAELCRGINEDLSSLMGKSKGRIVALGTVPLGSRDEGIEEMRRAVHELGLKGFMVLTNIGGRPVDQFERFWEEASRLGVCVYIHPVDAARPEGRPYEDEFDLSHVFGWPFETTLILCRIVFSGLLERYPGLRIVAHHLGGMIPFFSGRIDESYDKVSKKASIFRPEQIAAIKVGSSPFEHFRRFYYDTAVGGCEAAVRCGYQVFGSKRLIFSTDYPWGPDGGRARLATYPGIIRKLGLPVEEQAEVFEGNVRKVLKI